MTVYRQYIFVTLLLIGIFFSSFAKANDQCVFDGAKLTVGLPLYVAHSDDRGGNRDWNDGWFHNEGIFGDISWPVYSISPSTTLRLGGTAGIFDNSIFKTSVFLGGMGEIETFVTPKLSFNLGGYAGAITGYENRDVNPAFAPYIGTAYGITDDIDLGFRGLWLPGKTLGGSDIAGADAYVATFTISKRF